MRIIVTKKMSEQQLYIRLLSYRSEIADNAQSIYNEWDDNKNIFAGEGICDLIADSIEYILEKHGEWDRGIRWNSIHESHHTYVIVYNENETYYIDIPFQYYEKLHLGSWKKIPNVKFTTYSVIIKKSKT